MFQNNSKIGGFFGPISKADFHCPWEQRRLEKVADIIGGGTPDTSVLYYWDGEINWYSPAELGNSVYVSSSKRKITQEGLDHSSAQMLPKGTVLFSSRAGIGSTAILSDSACTNQGFQSIVPKKNLLDSYFIYSCTNQLKKYGEEKGAGSTFTEVSSKQMKQMNIFLPNTFSEQVQIGTLFEHMDSLITLHQRK